jgi:acyl transferase domain-containing protein
MTGNTDDPSSAIAVIGMAGRFPGADDVATFWANVCAGVESVTVAAPEELAGSGIPESVYGHPSYVPAKGRIEGIDLFDADFFGYSAYEAELTDPQHRLFLESAWAALEDAGHDPARFDGRIGVYAGQTVNTYLLYQAMRNPALVRSFYLDYMPMLVPANDDFLATRVAYKLDLHGPAMTVQTACSSSLVAIHQACQSLLYGECDLVLAGGVGLTVPDAFGHVYREGAGLSPDGHCRAFDETTSGIVGGSGLAVVVLRRLEDALRDGDTVHAVILGSAVNNDGSRKAGFSAPSVAGQAQVIADALAVANVSAGSVHFIEAHGTATAVGDAVEVAALTRAFRADTDRVGYCHLGSVKTNVGHLGAAAGVTSFLKAVLVVRDGIIPGTLHFRRANPKLSLESSPFVVRATSNGWPRHDGPRRAGVTSLGIGGTNAHVVVQEPPRVARSGESREWQLLLVSGRTPDALRTASHRLADALPARALPDAAYTLQVGRRAFEYRRAVVCHDTAEAGAALRGPAVPRRAAARAVALLFPGGGSQYAGMGRSLYAAEPVFRQHVDQCAELAAPGLGYDVREVLLAAGTAELARAEQRLAAPPGMLVALFTVDYALARLWLSWGVKPAAMLGHSLGEYVAACLAGVFDLPDAISAVLTRGELMAQLPPAAMLAVSLPEADLAPLLGTEVSLSAVNATRQCTVSGPVAAVEKLAARLGEQGVDVRRVHVRRPAHAREMEPVLDRFAAHLRGLTLRPPRERFLSNVTGTWITDGEATDPAYWVRHLRETVRFADAVRTLLEIPHLAVVEAGPGTTLGSLVTANLPAEGTELPVVASLPHPRDPQAEQRFLLASLGRLWAEGVDVDWTAYSAGERRLRVPLPTYPFERRRYWIDPPDTPAVAAAPSVATLEADFGSSLHERPDLFTAYAAPEGEVEEAVASVWRELLGFDRIGADDNFYALGGSSLLTVRLLSRLRERFAVEPDLEAFLAVHTVRDQSRILQELLAGSAPS